ncbi:hypothetical protein LguiA_005417 [Lonicera macranthoides]
MRNIDKTEELMHSRIHLDAHGNHVVMSNGLLNVTLLTPDGLITGISYKGQELLEILNLEDDREYWDVVWNTPGSDINRDKLTGTSFKVIIQNENQIELSFTKTWSEGDSKVPLNIDKRFIMLRGDTGFYAYTILERLKGWPDFDLQEGRMVFKLQQNKFHYMAVSDDRQRMMPMPEDRVTGQVLDYPEAVLLTKPTDQMLRGEVDDKYLYSCENKDNKVHGWISNDPSNEPPIGFWMITPSNEFRTGGPIKQDLTSHVGPTTLAMFISTHYAGKDLALEFRNGEPWKKVLGPVFVYLNSDMAAKNTPYVLWNDAKTRVARWPYDFPLSKDFLQSDQRGSVGGQLLVLDRYINKKAMPAYFAYVGLASPGESGSWQRESKGYQFWSQTDSRGDFLINAVRAGTYNLFAWVPGFIGDYKYRSTITIKPGSNIKLSGLVYEPPRTGATLWEIGVPDRSANEFYIPDPPPTLKSYSYENHVDKFRQYGLWARYADLYPDNDLVYTIGVSNYETDWFYAHVTRKAGENTFKATTWQIIFQMKSVNTNGIYTLRLALASANDAELQVEINEPSVPPFFTTGLIGKDNAIARHGIHGLYWLFNVSIPGCKLITGKNTIFLTQSRDVGEFRGIILDKDTTEELKHHHLRLDTHGKYVVMSNGLVKVTLLTPAGLITGISYKGLELLDTHNHEDNRVYWDFVWNIPNSPTISDKLEGTSFKVIMQDENQIELSFTRTWTQGDPYVPLNIDKRYVMLREDTGFYAYTVLERLKGWPDFDLQVGRAVFKLQRDKFHHMAISDDRQRVMPMPVDRKTGQVLDYKEAVLLTHPTNQMLKGEVDDKYLYSCDNKDNKVHGWISTDPPVGFWMITPTDEFRTGGPTKQSLTSHVGPTTLAIFISTHYAGEDLALKFINGEPWKKVFGPFFIYLNSDIAAKNNTFVLWKDAKARMLKETASWPYSFPLSKDFSHSDQRGSVEGQLVVHDRYMNKNAMPASFAYVGLAPPGTAGSWQRESKGYQFWTRADSKGNFLIKGVIAGNYNLYAWVPGFIGDYMYSSSVTIKPGSQIKLSGLVYDPPRTGATLWEIGVPDRTAEEFYIPNPNPTFRTYSYKKHVDKYRQYGLWLRYTDLYPQNDLVFTIGFSNYKRDWFFAHVKRNIGNNTYRGTTWRILFDLKSVNTNGSYTLQLALASANGAELQVRINNPSIRLPLFTTKLIGRDNAIARHGIHGLYWLFSISIPGNQLIKGRNTIFLTQPRGQGPFEGVMYDYIRLEEP